MRRLHIFLTAAGILAATRIPAVGAPGLKAGAAGGPWKAEVTLYNNSDAGRMCVGDATLLPKDVLIMPVT